MNKETQGDLNLIAMLGRFHHWTIQTKNSEDHGRYHSCTINHDHHLYTAQRRLPSDAIRAAIAKVSEGWHPKQKKIPGEKDSLGTPFMRLAK
jgi:hypothetical protein